MYAPKGNLRCFNKYSKPFFVCLQRAPIELIRWPTLRPCKFGSSPNVTPILRLYAARMLRHAPLNPPDHFTNRQSTASSSFCRRRSRMHSSGCSTLRAPGQHEENNNITEYSINECISVAEKHLTSPALSRLTSRLQLKYKSRLHVTRHSADDSSHRVGETARGRRRPRAVVQRRRVRILAMCGRPRCSNRLQGKGGELAV